MPRIQLPQAKRRRLERLDLQTQDADLRIRCRIGLKVAQGRSAWAAVAGAYAPGTGRLVCVDGDRKGSWLFLNLPRAPLSVYRGMGRIHLILDNYGIHTSTVARIFLRTIGAKIRLHFLPPYCP